MKKTAMLALAGLLATGATFAETMPAKDGNAQPKASQGACGEGKCAASKKGAMETCKEGQTPDKDNCMAADGKHGEGTCGGAKSGEGSCGADKK